ncbi:hypothetical protein [Burkholderia sola]|uniref:hypothetical protein n=1 Tax=Burkholderia sola TaxID=2843302 RepID=UPI001C0A8553
MSTAPRGDPGSIAHLSIERMSAALSGMVYDCPMTENQSIIEEIAMINCARKCLKFFADLPLTFRHHAPYGRGARRIAGIAEIHCFIHSRNIRLIEFRQNVCALSTGGLFWCFL